MQPIFGAMFTNRKFSHVEPKTRNVFLIIPGNKTGEIAVLANRELVIQFFKALEMPIYFAIQGDKSRALTSYYQLARALAKAPVLSIQVVPRDMTITPLRYEVVKAPIVKSL